MYLQILGSFTVAILTHFLLIFNFIFEPFLKNEGENEPKNDHF